MTHWNDLANFAIAITGLTLAALGLILSLLISNVELWTKRFLVVFFSFLMCDVAGGLMTTLSLTLLGSEGAFFTRLGIFLESVFPSLIMPMLSLFLLHCSHEDWRRSRLFHGALMLWLVYFVLLAVTQFTTFIYSIDSSNVYHRGTWYPLLLVPPVLLMGMNLAALYRRKSRLSPNQMKALRTALTFPIISILLQMVLFGLRFVVLGTMTSAMIMFIYILKEQVEESARQQINIKVLQMRPHFIYNIMTSIYYLCGLDPKKAQSVIEDFTVYLRKNFSAVVKHGLIPFDEELEHTKAYLAIEKARYEKLLFVEYDTPYTSFRLPPLTLQPIVENAVKHGVDAELSPLHIMIRTTQTENGHKVIVEDTGPGFSEQDYGDGAHIGISNIKERLRIMCGGILEIEAREDSGTVVTLSVMNMNYNNTGH